MCDSRVLFIRTESEPSNLKPNEDRRSPDRKQETHYRIRVNPGLPLNPIETSLFISMAEREPSNLKPNEDLR